MTLLGSVGWAAEEASRRLWWPSPDWRKAGRRGGGRGIPMEGEILPAPEGVLRIFSRRQPRSAFVLHGRNICSSGREAADPTLRAAP